MAHEPDKRNASDYRQWLGELKTRFRQVQLKAAVSVNTEPTHWSGPSSVMAVRHMQPMSDELPGPS